MKVKGSAVAAIFDYVSNKYPNLLSKWINSLSDDSKKIMVAPIYATTWYSLKDGMITPTKKLSELLGDENVAWDVGAYSAEQGLKGVYKIFILIASPAYILKRAGRVFQTYYEPSEMKVVKSKNKSTIIHITKFPEPDKIVEQRIGGWLHKALEITKCKNGKVEITKSLASGDKYTEFSIKWE